MTGAGHSKNDVNAAHCPRTALVTGGNRGIGYAICKGLLADGYAVYLGARDADAGRRAVVSLGGGDHVVCLHLDITDALSVEEALAQTEDNGGPVDVLINNVGVYSQESLLGAGHNALSEALEINALGAYHMTRAFLPGMNARGYGRIVNISSGYGAVCSGLSGPPLYAISKATLNALTQAAAREAAKGVAVAAMCPGWVRTRMGGNGASRSPEEAADTALWLAAQDDTSANGRFFRDREEIPW